jgi:serine/threonine protein kinase
MAPEQKSAPENVDHRADIYSLGVVLYEMLTGELPSKQLEAPSSRVTGVHFDVRLDEIVLRALHAQPELRYHTALDLKTQLESLGERQPRSPSRTFPVDERASRRSTPANSNTTSKPRASAIRRGLSIMCSLLIIGAGINVTSELLWPRYYAKVLMEVQPEKQPYRDQPWNARALYDAFVAEQKRKLRAPETLARVAQELRLESGFSLFANDITAQLARSIEIHEVRNRGPLMELGVYNRNPELAAKIANTLAMVYQDLRLKEFQAKVEQSLARLNSEVELQRKRMQHAAAERDEILRRDQIVDPAPDDFQSPGEMTNRQIADLENRAKAQKETVDNLRMQLSAIINLEPLEIRQVLQTLKIDDPLVAKAFGALNMQLAEQLRLTSSGLGEEHPAVVSTRALITEYTRQLTEMLQSFRQIRSNKLEIEERALREITGELEATKAHATMPPEKLKRYLEAKTRYIEARKVFEAAEKFRIDQLQHNLDFEGPKIWERAETPPRVSWPTFRQLWYSLSHPLS